MTRRSTRRTWNSSASRIPPSGDAAADGPRLLAWNELRRRDEVVEMPPDDLLDDHVGMFLENGIRVEIVLPQIDRAAEVLGREWREPRKERVAEDHRPRQA